MHIAVCILRLSGGLDYSMIVNENEDPDNQATFKHRDSHGFSQLSQG